MISTNIIVLHSIVALIGIVAQEPFDCTPGLEKSYHAYYCDYNLVDCKYNSAIVTTNYKFVFKTLSINDDYNVRKHLDPTDNDYQCFSNYCCRLNYNFLKESTIRMNLSIINDNTMLMNFNKMKPCSKLFFSKGSREYLICDEEEGRKIHIVTRDRKIGEFSKNCNKYNIKDLTLYTCNITSASNTTRVTSTINVNTTIRSTVTLHASTSSTAQSIHLTIMRNIWYLLLIIITALTRKLNT